MPEVIPPSRPVCLEDVPVVLDNGEWLFGVEADAVGIGLPLCEPVCVPCTDLVVERRLTVNVRDLVITMPFVMVSE